MKKLLFTLAIITIAVIGSRCQRTEYSATTVGIYTNGYDSLTVAPQPESIEIGRSSIDIRYRWGAVPFTVVSQSANGYPVKDNELDSLRRVFYRLVNPISGDTISAVYMENYSMGRLVRRELAMQLYGGKQLKPILAFIKSYGH